MIVQLDYTITKCCMLPCLQTAQLDDGLATLNNVDINSTRALITSGTSIINNISNIIDQQLSNFSEPINSRNNYVIILPLRYP